MIRAPFLARGPALVPDLVLLGEMRVLVQHPRRWALALGLALGAGAGPAAAQRPIVDANGAVNVGFAQTTQPIFQADPNAEPEDIPESTSNRAFTEIRPGIAVQSGSPRLIWRAGYQLSGNFAFDGGAPIYSNQAEGALIALPSKYTSATVSATLAQGGTAFLLSQRSAESGQPEIRAPGNPNIVSATLAESLAWNAGRRLSLSHNLSGSASAPQDDLGAANAALTATLALDLRFPRNNVGLEVRASVSRLRPLRADLDPYLSTSNALVGRWNHDFSPGWNGIATAGIEQVYTDTGSEPLALLPNGSITLLYTSGETAGALELSHGTATNVQVGTVSITDRIGARGVYTLDADKLRSLSFSAGFLHNEPIGESAALVAAGTGNAVQTDAGFTTALMKNVLLNARYTLAYQYGQVGGLGATVAHIFLVGVTGRLSNTSETRRPMPTRGRRVDGSDGLGFPAGGNPVGGDGASSSPSP